MKRKIFILLFAPLIIILIAAFALIIQPKETVINETMRFYQFKSVDGYSDDTKLEELADKFIEVEADFKVLQGVGSDYVEGTLKIENELFYIGSSIKGDVHGIVRTLNGKGHGMDASFMSISDDLKHIFLYLENSSANGGWTNASTLSDFKAGTKNLYPFN